MAKLEAHEERAREIESYVADLQEKCEGLLDSEILAVARKGGVEAVKKMLEEPLPEKKCCGSQCKCERQPHPG